MCETFVKWEATDSYLCTGLFYTGPPPPGRSTAPHSAGGSDPKTHRCHSSAGVSFHSTSLNRHTHTHTKGDGLKCERRLKNRFLFKWIFEMVKNLWGDQKQMTRKTRKWSESNPCPRHVLKNTLQIGKHLQTWWANWRSTHQLFFSKLTSV